MLGDIAGLRDYGLFSAPLFKAQLSGVPLGLSPPVAAVSVLQGSWAVASVIVAEMLALGTLTVFLPGYFYMLSRPQHLTLGCLCLKGLFSCGPDGTSWLLNGGVLDH